MNEITIIGDFPFQNKWSCGKSSWTLERDGSINIEGADETIVFKKKPTYIGNHETADGEKVYVDAVIGPAVEVNRVLYKWAIKGKVPEDAIIAKNVRNRSVSTCG